MTRQDVEAIIRRVIVERALPFDLITVAALPSAWDVRLRHQASGVVSVTIPDGRPVDIRVSIQERLEDQF